jgi:Flp pilus assembly protein TadB
MFTKSYQPRERHLDWFYLYVLGFLVVLAGVALGLNLIGVPPLWIVLIVLALAALGAVGALRSPGGGDRES